MLIQGKLTHMVPFSEEHLYDPAYYKWLQDIDVVRYLGRDELLAGYPFAEAENYVKQLWANEHCHFFAVHDRESGKFIGTAKLNFVTEHDRKHGIVDVGLMLGDRNFWARGMSTDLLRAISAYAFDVLKVRKLSAGANSLNIAVVKAFVRIGFKVDGTLRQQLHADKRYCDHVLLSCFESELARE